MYSHGFDPRQEIADMLRRIYERRLTTTSGGNVSVRTDDGIWITPARVDKGALKPEDVVRVAPDGTVQGVHPPSSEFPFHQGVFDLRPDISAVIHAHPPGLVALSIADNTPDLQRLPAVSGICGTVGYASYAMPGSEALGRAIGDAFAKGADCVIMENHGVVVGGASLADAFRRFETLEACASTCIKAQQLRDAPRYQVKRQKMCQDRAPSVPAAASAATATEADLREELCRFIIRGYAQRLFTSAQGSCSIRLNDEAFIINCQDADRMKIAPRETALVSRGRCEEAPQPNCEVTIHDAIYRRHSDVRAVIVAAPVNAMAYCLADRVPDTRVLPESYIFVRDLEMVSSSSRDGVLEGITSRISSHQPAVLLKDAGVVVTGTSMLQAFDRLEVLELTAEANLCGRSLGRVRSISDKRIDDLMRVFL